MLVFQCQMLILSCNVYTHTNTLSPKMYFVPYLSLKIHIYSMWSIISTKNKVRFLFNKRYIYLYVCK